MRTPLLLLALAALAAAGAAGWFLLRPVAGPPGPTPVPVDGGSTTPDPVEALGDGNPNPAPPPPGPGGRPPRTPRRDAEGRLLRPDGSVRPEPLRGEDAWREEKDGVAPREPKPPAEGVLPGEFIPEGLSEEEEKGVAILREKMMGVPLETVRYHSRSLQSVASEIAAAAGVTLELSGEDLADEPVTGEYQGTDCFDRLMRIAVDRNLRLEMRPDRIVIRR